MLFTEQVRARGVHTSSHGPPKALSELDPLIEPVRDRRPAPVLPPGTRTRPVTWHWWVAAVACVALVATSAAVWIDADRTLREVPGLQQGVALLRFEREAGVAVGRLGLQAMAAAYDDSTFHDLPQARAATVSTLKRLDARLDAMEALPAWETTVQRLDETLEGGIRRLEAPDPPPEGLWAWQWAFTTSFSGIFPADLTGRWSSLLEFTLGSQYGVYVPVSFAELVLARWADDGGPAAVHPGLRAYIDGEGARIDKLVEDYDGTSPFDPEFSLERARELDPRWGPRVAALRNAASVQAIEAGYTWLAGASASEPWQQSPEALFAATDRALGVLDVVGEELLSSAEARLASTAAEARLRAALAVVLGIVVAFLGLGVLGWWMAARNRLELSLRVAAEHDALTGVDSRWSLFYHEEPLLLKGSSKGVALLLTDMDDFKSINDRWGHTVGDLALIRFAEACEAVVEPGDRVARIGGDEFVLVLHGRRSPAADAARMAERLHEALAKPVNVEGVRLHLKATIGIAVAQGPMALDELLLQADTALLDAKKTRRNRHALYSRNYRRALIREIDAALEGGAIEPVFQPIVRSHDLRLTGAELLARWTREDGSQVPLDSLIEAMVSVGASGVWTERMLLAAAKVIPFLPGSDMRFWLNVAMPDLVGPGAQVLVDTVASGPVPPHRLGIEITERILPSDLSEARSTLLTLRASGLEIALDDVGTDGVPLRHLTELPLDRVKLDGSLVRGVDTSNENRALLRAIVIGATDLGLEIVAEAVETEGEAAVLKYLGVQHLQGYKTGAPVTIDTFITAARRQATLAPTR